MESHEIFWCDGGSQSTIGPMKLYGDISYSHLVRVLLNVEDLILENSKLHHTNSECYHYLLTFTLVTH